MNPTAPGKDIGDGFSLGSQAGPGVLVLGASRGLGAHLSEVATRAGWPVTGVARKEPLLAELGLRLKNFDYWVGDFSRPESQDAIFRRFEERRSSYAKIFCVAGGGPYGPFCKSSWASHAWALNVTFTFHARMIHSVLQERERGSDTGSGFPLPQVILLGSSVAENSADIGAASYCAAKHALRGLYETLRAEAPKLDLRLFSPGYMDTQMLPKNAKMREKGVYDPVKIAEEIWAWSLSSEHGGHRLYPPHPPA